MIGRALSIDSTICITEDTSCTPSAPFLLQQKVAAVFHSPAVDDYGCSRQTTRETLCESSVAPEGGYTFGNTVRSSATGIVAG